MVVAVCLITGLATGLGIRSWLQRRHDKRAPLRTFKQLANEIGIGSGDQALLVRIARQQALPTPLTLLLSSATFEHHLQRYIDTLTSFERDRVKQTMTALERGLFGQTRPPIETRSR